MFSAKMGRFTLQSTLTSKNTLISKPNKCDGCPLKDVPIEFKVANLCNKLNPQFEVKYSLDDLGHTICKVRLKMWLP